MIAKPAKRKQRNFRLQWQIVDFLASSAAYYFRECTGVFLKFCKMQRAGRSTLVHPCVTVWNAARECMTWKWCVKSWSRSGFPPLFFLGGEEWGVRKDWCTLTRRWNMFFFGGVIFSLWHVSPGWHVYVFTYLYIILYLYVWEKILYFQRQWKNERTLKKRTFDMIFLSFHLGVICF